MGGWISQGYNSLGAGGPLSSVSENVGKGRWDEKLQACKNPIENLRPLTLIPQQKSQKKR